VLGSLYTIYMSRKFLASLAFAFLLPIPFLFPLFFPLGWIAFLPLFWALERCGSLRHAFLLGWFSGWVAHLVGFYWLDYTIRVFGGFPYGVSEFIFVLFGTYSALPLALFSLLVRLCGLGPLSLFPALFWVAGEFWFPHLFPWYLANSQSEFLVFIQSADLVGLYGTSFFLMWFNSTVSSLIFDRERGARALLANAAVLSAVLMGLLVYGYLRLQGVEAEMRGARTLPVAAIQGNIGIEKKWDPAQLKNNLLAYQNLTEKAPRARVVIWPETAIEVWLPEDLQRLPAELLPPLREETFFLFGANSFRGGRATPKIEAFNSAFLTDGRGIILSRYHKQVLLAFGEYIPFSRLLSKIPGIPPMDGFSEGRGPTTLDVSDGVRIGPLICYEDLMPELARAFVMERNANILVNLTNDAWYGKTVAPWQHAWLAKWRAIETRRTLVRVTNTGLTTVINPKGELVKSLPIFSAGILTAAVEIMEGETFYVRFGDWFPWLISGAALAILLWRIRPRLKFQIADFRQRI